MTGLIVGLIIGLLVAVGVAPVDEHTAIARVADDDVLAEGAAVIPQVIGHDQEHVGPVGRRWCRGARRGHACRCHNGRQGCGQPFLQQARAFVVHTAPAHGVDDYNIGKQYGLPVNNPVGNDGKFISTVPALS